MCLCCGAALGMVLSSAPIFILIPLVAWLSARLRPAGFILVVKRTTLGVVVAALVYLMTNPYILINALTNREVLRSNFGNSLAMYEIARLGEGFLRVIELTVEGATLPVVILGLVALLATLLPRRAAQGGLNESVESPPLPKGEASPGDDISVISLRITLLPLFVPAAVLFLQFVLIGAGKPAEFGRFGVFTNTALAIGAACLLTRRWTRLRGLVNGLPAVIVLLWVSLYGTMYLANFQADATEKASRIQMHGVGSLEQPSPGRDQTSPVKLATLAEPAPYCFPPIDFSRIDVLLFRSREQFAAHDTHHEIYLLETVDGIQEAPVGDRLPGWGVARFHESQGLADLLPQSVRDRLSLGETPISWANKSFLHAAGKHTPTKNNRAFRLPRSE